MECFVCGSDKVKKEDRNFKELDFHFFCEDCGEFYLEPVFQASYDAFLLRYGSEKEASIKAEMKRLVKKYHKVYFVGNFENPMVKGKDDFVFLELTDILNPLGFIVDDISRGSDYGD